ncbi:hypothetical protein [Virgibacillus sediminis]|uniref:Uncharacterized protein n=1 Tax=Virgibacillus sediminis TaxID=202260 RepID=A0ABV7A5Z7_9BACI
MTNYLELSREYNLDLTEISVLVQLDKRYPNAVTIEELTDDRQLQMYGKKIIERLIEKKIVYRCAGGYLRRKEH